MRRPDHRATLIRTIILQWCPACGRQVPTFLELCDWCDWELPDECDTALKRWNDIMDEIDRPELKDSLGFEHGCGCICPSCRSRYYGHPYICPIYIATHPNTLEMIMSWALESGLNPLDSNVIYSWEAELHPFTKQIAFQRLKEGEDAKTVG